MAKGFAAGLSKGLETAEEQSLKRSQENRMAAIQTAQVGMQMEDQAFKREERERAKSLREEMGALWSGTYGAKEIEVEEPVPGAIPTDDPTQTSASMVQKVKKQVVVNPGERTAEGRQRDLDFFNKMTAVRAKYSEFSPEQMKQAMEYGRFLEKEGLEDGITKLILTNDPSGLAPLAGRLGVDPKSLQVESVNNNGVPSMVLIAQDANGNPIRKDLEDVLFSIGIKNLSDSTDKKLGRKKAIADIDLTKARTDDARADASYSQARAADARAGKVNTADKDYLPKIPIGGDKPVLDPGAGTARRLLESVAKEDDEMTGAEAREWAAESHARISSTAQQKVEAEEKASGKKLGVEAYNSRYQSIRNQLTNDYVALQKKLNNKSKE
jgi:hypothetical protein